MRKILTALFVFALAACSIYAFAENSEHAELPAYSYSGDDPIIGAVANYIAETTPEYYDSSKITVAIPAPVILKTVMPDETRADVFGAFWHMRYERQSTLLISVSGGEAAGIMHLVLTDDVWSVASVEIAGDGTDYAKDIKRFCDGDKELERAYFSSADIRQDHVKSIRTQFIRDYVEANGLEITAYQDPYWDPIKLFE